MAESPEIFQCHQPGAVAADVDAIPLCNSLCAPVWSFADMPVAYAGGIGFRFEADGCQFSPERCLGKRRPANVTETHE
jgi:hypothetical protein